MADCETVIVFKILGVLANARNFGHALVIEEIAAALRLGRSRVEQYLTVLQRAGAVRAASDPTHSPSYSLTPYGLARCAGGRTH